MKSENFLQDLKIQTYDHIQRIHNLFAFNDQILGYKTGTAWSVFECCEHLNKYFEFYLPEIERSISSSKFCGNKHFKHGIIGGFLAKSMLPGGMKKMKSPKDKDPSGEILNKSTIIKLLSNFKKFQNLLEQSSDVDLSRTRVKISVTRLIRLKLGDTLQFIVNHNERHLQQMETLGRKAAAAALPQP